MAGADTSIYEPAELERFRFLISMVVLGSGNLSPMLSVFHFASLPMAGCLGDPVEAVMLTLG